MASNHSGARHDSIESAHLRHRRLWEDQQRADFGARVDELTRAIELDPSLPQPYWELAAHYLRNRESTRALAVLSQVLQSCRPEPRTYLELASILEQKNEVQAASNALRLGLKAFPGHFGLMLREATLLPLFYASEEAIRQHRNQFSNRTRALFRGLRLDSPVAIASAMDGLNSDRWNSLSHSGGHDKTLRRNYARIYETIVRAKYPIRPSRLPMPPPDPDGRLRIGFVSSAFCNSSAMKAFGGWIRELDRTRFRIFTYYPGGVTDRVTEQVRGWSEKLLVSSNVEELVAAIDSNALHALIYLDHGVRPLTTQMAALRLAPVQCMAWDQPVTSGLSSIDYFLSADLFEPPGAGNHYVEKLVQLPGLGFCFQKPAIPRLLLTKTRADFDIAPDAVVYLSGQQIGRHLPIQDRLYAGIAKRVNASLFVMLVKSGVEDDVRARMRESFLREGLSVDRHLKLLPEMNPLDYWSLLTSADVLLDNCGWFGAVSSMEAIECGLPLVTWPGPVMRARQTAGILRQLGVLETIAADSAGYIDIASRLGHDRVWRAEIVNKMKANKEDLYERTEGLRFLERFLCKLVAVEPVGAEPKTTTSSRALGR